MDENVVAKAVEESEDLDGGLVLPYDPSNPEATRSESLDMAKALGWGAPAPGGMGGRYITPSDDGYDPTSKPTPWEEVGATGLAQYGGFVQDEFLKQLQGQRGLTVYREMMDNDAVVGAFVFAIQMLVRKVEWRVEPPDAASVEDIVAERELERQQAMAVTQQAKQQQMMMAQAGIAGKLQAGGSAAPPAKPTGGGSAFARPAGNDPFHSPLSKPGGGAPGAAKPPAGPPGMAKMIEDMVKAAMAGHQIDGAPPNMPAANPPKSAPGMQGDIDSAKPGSNQLVPNGMDPQAPETPEDRKGKELAVFVETCLHDMSTSWGDFISQCVTMVVFGFHFAEIIYKKRKGPNVDDPRQGSRFDDGKVGWADLSGRAQETVFRWEFDDKGHPIGMWQMAPPKYQLRYIPFMKALNFRTTAYKDNPQGRSLLRSAYRSWFFLKKLQEYEAIGVERDAGGLPVAWLPAAYFTETATQGQKATLEACKEIVKNIRANEQAGVAWPLAYDEAGNKLFDLTLLVAQGGRSRIETDKIIRRYESRILMTVLAEVLTLGQDGVGARSLGDTQTELFQAALETIVNIIADTMNTFAIPRLMKLNNEDPARSPKLVPGKLTQATVQEIGQLITALSGAGADMFPDVALEDWVRNIVGMPPKQASDDL